MANTNIVPQGLFGPGILFLKRTDLANQTPYNVGFIQELSYDIKGSPKQLFGQNQYPLLTAIGTKKASGKMKPAVLSLSVLNALIFGGTPTVGTEYDIATSAVTAIPATPFQITPTVPSTGTWDSDCGVIDATSGEPFVLVTGTPAAGQYAVSAGVYTFASADNVSGLSVKISFSYHWSSGSKGQNLVVANALIGTTPTFQIDYKTTLYGATYFVRFYNVIGTGWTQAHKLEDFAPPELDFEFFVNAAGNLMLISAATTA